MENTAVKWRAIKRTYLNKACGIRDRIIARWEGTEEARRHLVDFGRAYLYPDKEKTDDELRENFQKAKRISDFTEIIVSFVFLTGVSSLCWAKAFGKVSAFDRSSLAVAAIFSVSLSFILYLRICNIILRYLYRDNFMGPLWLRILFIPSLYLQYFFILRATQIVADVLAANFAKGCV